MTTITHDVFISHSSKDKEVVSFICDSLEKCKLRIWKAPGSIHPAKPFMAEIIHGIEVAQVMVLIFTKNSSESIWVRGEVERAISKGKVVIPFIKEDIELDKEWEGYISRMQWLDAKNVDIEISIKELIKVIKSLIDLPPSHDRVVHPNDSDPAKGGTPSNNKIDKGNGPSVFLNNVRQYGLNKLEWKKLDKLDNYSIKLKAREDSDSQHFYVDDFYGNSNRLVIIGSPGSGKTVSHLKYYKSLCEKLSKIEDFQNPNITIEIPVFLEISYFKIVGDSSSDYSSFYDLLNIILNELGIGEISDPVSSFLALFNQSNVSIYLFFDGFNEISLNHQKHLIKQLDLIEDILNSSGKDKQVKIAINSRSYGFNNMIFTNYKIIEVMPLSIDEIEDQINFEITKSSKQRTNLDPKLDSKIRFLLSNPQHLDIFINYYPTNSHNSVTNENNIISKGQLLKSFVEDKLSKTFLNNPEIQRLIFAILSKVAYQTSKRNEVSFSYESLSNVIDYNLKKGHYSKLSVESIRNDLFLSEIVLINKDNDRCRFLHHSIHQYFTAIYIKQDWEVKDYFIKSQWHEILVIMAGIMERDERKSFLSAIENNDRLYAYILANINEPDLEETFILEKTNDFIKKTNYWGLGLSKILSALFIGWFIVLSILLISSLSSMSKQINLTFVISSLIYVFVIPIILKGLFNWKYRQKLQSLSVYELPNIISILKFLSSEGAAKILKRNLISLDNKISASDKDPRKSFIKYTLKEVEELSDISYLSEDEILDQLDKPIVAATLNVNQLSDEGIHILFEKARLATSEIEILSIIEVFKELYNVNIELRKDISSLFKILYESENITKRQKKYILRTCNQLNIKNIKRDSWLSRIFAKIPLILSKSKV